PSRVEKSVPGRWSGSFLNERLGRYPLGNEVLDDISHFDVAIVGDGDAAFHAVPHFADVFLEASHRTDLAFEHNHVVAQQAHFGIALDDAVSDVTAGHSTHFRNTESVAHLGASEVGLFDDRLEQSGHGALDFILKLVNDRVQADVHLFLLRQFLRLALRPHIESDNHGVRRGGQEDVGFSNCAHATKQDLDLYPVVRQLGQQVTQDFYRALYVALQDDVQLLLACGLQLLGQALERHARTLCQLR